MLQMHVKCWGGLSVKALQGWGTFVMLALPSMVRALAAAVLLLCHEARDDSELALDLASAECRACAQVMLGEWVASEIATVRIREPSVLFGC